MACQDSARHADRGRHGPLGRRRAARSVRTSAGFSTSAQSRRCRSGRTHLHAAGRRRTGHCSSAADLLGEAVRCRRGPFRHPLGDQLRRRGSRTMTADLEPFHVKSRRQGRAWLTRHHTSSPGVWLVFYKTHTGVKSIPYEDMVREALCFGWIVSLVKRLDDDRYALKVTPRKRASKWSAPNRRRWGELEAAGLLTPAGLAAAPTGNTYAPRPVVPILPGYIAKALKAEPKAWEFFQKLAPTHRRNFVVWIHVAKRPETREKRRSRIDR